MSGYITLQPDQHKSAGYTPAKSFQFASEISVVPILKDEVANTIGQMCLAFRKTLVGEVQSFDLVAMQSLQHDRNFFILPDGRWFRGYIPAFYRAYPFALKQGGKSNQLQICVNSDAIITEPAEEDLRFFDDKPELSPHLQSVLKFLVTTLQNRQVTINLCKMLDEANLIIEWPITFSEPDDNNQLQKKTLRGLYHIDAQAISQLSGEQLVSLNHSGALSLAYSQLLSEARLKELAELQTAYRQMEVNNQQQAQQQEVPDLDSLFGQDDDLLSF